MTEPPTSYLPRTPRPPRRRAILHVSAEQLAALLRLPDDVTIAGFAVEPIRDSVAFLLDSDRFDPVPECAEPPRLFADIAVEVDDDGAATQRVTWPELEGAGITVQHEAPAPTDVYRRRGAAVRARQWLGTNEAEIQELAGGDFFALAQPEAEDPDATASLLTAPHNTWVLVYDGDWIVSFDGGAGWVRMTNEEFVAAYEPVTA